MKFVYPDIQYVFDTENDRVNTLIIENQQLFYAVLSDLYGQIQGMDGRSVVSVDNKILPLDRNLEVLSQFVPFSLNQKALVNRLVSEIEKKAVFTDRYEATMKVVSDLEALLLDVSFDCIGDIEFSKVNIGSLIKAAGPAFAEEYDSLAEKIIDYFELVTEYDRSKLFILVNLRSYISDDETFEFVDTVLRHQYHVIMIENCEHSRLENEQRLIIDKDLCEI